MKKAMLYVISILLVATMTLTSCAQGTKQGEVLKVGQLAMLSGVMALYGEQQVRGFELGLEYMSGGEMDEEGRYIIAGRPIEVITDRKSVV